MKRLIATFAAVLMLAVGVPGVANASGFSAGDSISLIDVGNTPTWANGWNPFPGSATLGDIAESNSLSLVNNFYSMQVTDSSVFTMTETTKNVFEDVIQNIIPISGPGVAARPNHWKPVVGARYQVFETLKDGVTSSSTDWYTEIRISNGSIARWALSISNPILIVQLDESPTDPLTTSTPVLKRNGISFTPDNFDPTCAYEISTTAGTVKQNPVTGEVNVYGVGSGSSVTVTITDCTGATATVSGRATAATAPIQTLTKPTVAVAADAITCSAGTSTVNPTSIAYTLLVDGVAVSTRFSDGAIAPSLVTTTAAQNLYTGATLSKATWTIDPAWAGKSYSCTTTSYAAGAVGIANS